MTKIAIPYGEKMVEFSLPEETFIGMTDPPAAQAAENPEKVLQPVVKKRETERKIPKTKFLHFFFSSCLHMAFSL